MTPIEVNSSLVGVLKKVDVKKNSYQGKTGGVFFMVQNPLPPPPKEIRNSQGKSQGAPEYKSSGREPYVFRVEKPEDLRGLHICVHADLMERALRCDEELLYLLYSPIFEAKKAPFGLQASPASHAVAVTKRRFIISDFDVPFDEGSLRDAEALVHFLTQNMMTEREACILQVERKR
jgi:hypothetical protein